MHTQSADLPAQPAPDRARGGAQAPRDGGSVSHADALARLQALDPQGASGLVERVLRTYAHSLEQLGDAMGAALLAGDVVEVGKHAHTLKSPSGSVGASRLAALCASLERRTKAVQVPGGAAAEGPSGAPPGAQASAELAAETNALLREVARARAELRAMLPD